MSTARQKIGYPKLYIVDADDLDGKIPRCSECDVELLNGMEVVMDVWIYYEEGEDAYSLATYYHCSCWDDSIQAWLSQVQGTGSQNFVLSVKSSKFLVPQITETYIETT